MKLNKKGFMMAEVVVVSSIILVFLAALYTSYTSIYSIYKKRLNYYDNQLIYQLGYYRDTCIETYNFNDMLIESNTNTVTIFNKEPTEDGYFDTVLLAHLTNKKINNIALYSNLNINKTYKEYIDYLKTSATMDSNYIMLIERCNSSNIDCKYGYIEIYDGHE